MTCSKCGKRIRSDELFCEDCGARINRATVVDTSKKKRRKRKRGKIIALFVCLGIVALIILCIGIILFVKNRKAAIVPASANESIGASTSNEAEWKNTYRMFLEEMLLERFGQDGAHTGIRMTLLDVNFDGIPELFDCRYEAEEQFLMTAYCISDGCTTVLGTAHIGESINKRSPDLLLCYNAALDDAYYLSMGKAGSNEYCVEEMSAWGSEASAALPYYENISLVQSSDSANRLSDSVGKENIYFDSESNTYKAYALYSAYISPEEYENQSAAFIEIMFLIDYSIAWFTDGDYYQTDPTVHSIYQIEKSEGKTDREAAGTVIDELFAFYETIQGKNITLNKQQETQLIELARATLGRSPFRDISELTTEETIVFLRNLLCNNENGRFAPDAAYSNNGIVIPVNTANAYLADIFGKRCCLINESEIPIDFAANYTQEGLLFEWGDVNFENCSIKSYRTLQDGSLFVEFVGYSLYDNVPQTCRMIVIPCDNRFGFQISSLCKTFY